MKDGRGLAPESEALRRLPDSLEPYDVRDHSDMQSSEGRFQGKEWQAPQTGASPQSAKCRGRHEGNPSESEPLSGHLHFSPSFSSFSVRWLLQSILLARIDRSCHLQPVVFCAPDAQSGRREWMAGVGGRDTDKNVAMQACKRRVPPSFLSIKARLHI